jgi:hypothetical protein
MATAYLQNSESVTSETFDDDTVLINFLTGTYFSLRGSAPAIWRLLESPISLEKVVEAVSGDSSGAREAIQRMLDVLVAEDCVRNVEVDASAMAMPQTTSTPYTPPIIEVFHDLQELISIDPVHDVDEVDGWPHRNSPPHPE